MACDPGCFSGWTIHAKWQSGFPEKSILEHDFESSKTKAPKYIDICIRI
jgi:hypothetical protein